MTRGSTTPHLPACSHRRLDCSRSGRCRPLAARHLRRRKRGGGRRKRQNVHARRQLQRHARNVRHAGSSKNTATVAPLRRAWSGAACLVQGAPNSPHRRLHRRHCHPGGRWSNGSRIRLAKAWDGLRNSPGRSTGAKSRCSVASHVKAWAAVRSSLARRHGSHERRRAPRLPLLAAAGVSTTLLRGAVRAARTKSLLRQMPCAPRRRTVGNARVRLRRAAAEVSRNAGAAVAALCRSGGRAPTTRRAAVAPPTTVRAACLQTWRSCTRGAPRPHLRRRSRARRSSTAAQRRRSRARRAVTRPSVTLLHRHSSSDRARRHPSLTLLHRRRRRSSSNSRARRHPSSTLRRRLHSHRSLTARHSRTGGGPSVAGHTPTLPCRSLTAALQATTARGRRSRRRRRSLTVALQATTARGHRSRRRHRSLTAALQATTARGHRSRRRHSLAARQPATTVRGRKSHPRSSAAAL